MCRFFSCGYVEDRVGPYERMNAQEMSSDVADCLPRKKYLRDGKLQDIEGLLHGLSLGAVELVRAKPFRLILSTPASGDPFWPRHE